MANRTIGDFARNTLVVPNYQPDYSGAKLLSHVGALTGQAADEAIAEWQGAVVKEATEEGAVAGAKAVNPEDVPFRDKSTLSAQAFNKAAITASTAKAQAFSSVEVQKIGAMHPNDPEAYQKNVNEYINGRTKTLIENPDPVKQKMGHDLKNNLKLQAEQKLIGINNEAAKDSAAKVTKDIEDTMTILELQQEDENGTLFSEDKDIARESFIQFQHGLKNIQTMAMQVDPLTGKRRYNEAEVATITDRVTRTYIKAQVMSVVNNPNTPDDVLLDIADGTFTTKLSDTIEVDPRYALGSDGYKVVQQQVATVLKARTAADAKVQEDRNKAITINQGLKFNSMVMRQKQDPNSVTYQEIQTAVKNREITPEKGTKLINDIGKDPEIESDPVYVAQFKALLDNGMPEKAQEFLNENADKFTHADIIGNTSAVAQAADKAANAIHTSNIQSFEKIALKPDPFGQFDQRADREMVNTIEQVYRNNVASGLTPELAYQLMTDEWTDYKDTATTKFVDDYTAQYSRFVVQNPDGTMDPVATSNNIATAGKRGEINREMEADAIKKTFALYNFQHPEKVTPTYIPPEVDTFDWFRPSTWF